jgi:RNA polymerase sigma-70 factor (ECF subfamily)
MASKNRQRAGDRAPGHVGLGHLDDRALMATIADGDAAALDQLYIRYRSLAFAAAHAVLQDPDAAEDTVHDAFLRVWRSASSFQPERGPPRPWLLTIVRNSAIDRLRARQLARRSHTELVLDTLHAPSDEDVCATVTTAAEVRRLHAALAALPSSQRTAIELAFIGGLTHSQIADLTGMPLGTVKGRVRLGLRRLRQDFGAAMTT